VVRILLHGLAGPIQVAGQTYAGVMPAWREQLSDADVAAVATFIRQWGPNEAAPVEADLVRDLRAATASRATPWTAEDLRAAAGGGQATGDGS
jgi:mono/diheme cytochrome c family protein